MILIYCKYFLLCHQLLSIIHLIKHKILVVMLLDIMLVVMLHINQHSYLLMIKIVLNSQMHAKIVVIHHVLLFFVTNPQGIKSELIFQAGIRLKTNNLGSLHYNQLTYLKHLLHLKSIILSQGKGSFNFPASLVSYF